MEVDLLKFFSNIMIDEHDCWNRTKDRRIDGYTRINVDKKKIYAHRFIYEYYHGQIHPDLQIDHLCRNPSCVNPLHLEQVTLKENLKRGSNYRRDKTACPQGHEYNKKNTWYYPTYRRCKICSKTQHQGYYQNRKMLSVNTINC